MTTDLARRAQPRRRRDDDLCPICGYPGGSAADHGELTSGCAGDGRCTDPRCERHGIAWDPEMATGSVGAGEDGTVTP